MEKTEIMKLAAQEGSENGPSGHGPEPGWLRAPRQGRSSSRTAAGTWPSPDTGEKGRKETSAGYTLAGSKSPPMSAGTGSPN